MQKSWKTDLAGWVVIGGDIVGLIGHTIQSQGVPTDVVTWIAFGTALATGIGLLMSKDKDKTGITK